MDLPGGNPFHGEPLLEALKREIREETGLEIAYPSFFGNFSFLIPYLDSEGNQRELYHIALIYRVNSVDCKNFHAAITKEDVKGSLWLHWQNIQNKESSHPLRSVLETYAKIM